MGAVMNSIPGPTPTAPPSTIGYHGAVSDFKRRLIEATLHQARGNRTHAARALGLQRTYLLRLIRDLGVAGPSRPTPAPAAPEARRVEVDLWRPARQSVGRHA